MNNCICAERGFTDRKIIRKIMEKSAEAVGAFEFDGLKLDSCSQFNNLTSSAGAETNHHPPGPGCALQILTTTRVPLGMTRE